MNQKPFKELVDERNISQEESIRVGLILSLAIGILNACTYICRGSVFASSQSGNLLLMGLDISHGNWSQAPKYLFPVIMSGIGVIIAEHYHDRPDYRQWRKIPFIIEVVLIAAGSFLPNSWDRVANATFALACGLQTITFRRIHGQPVSTVVINGSYLNSLEHYTKFLHIKNPEDAFRALLYFTLVVAYFAGIVIGAWLVNLLGLLTSLVSAAMIACCIWIVVDDKHKEKKEDLQA